MSVIPIPTPPIPLLDQGAMQEARARMDVLTKPLGSLGRLERLAVHVAGITGCPRPRLPRKSIIIMAGDHGVAARGVSAYPTAVTEQMVRSFARGTAAINVLGRQVGARITVVDVGVAATLPASVNVVKRKVAHGTADLSVGPAMTRDQAARAIGVGMDIAADEAARGMDVVCLGEMGIGNSTAASALVAAVTGRPPAEVTGRGTGIDDRALERKIAVVQAALAVNGAHLDNPFDTLAALGGLEIAALVGVAIEAAARRTVVVLDGFIATAAAMMAVEMDPAVRPFLVAAHRSVEPGHQAALAHLDLEPLLALDLRLGEGTGAALALPVLDAALALLDEMATFAEAGVSTANDTDATALARPVSRSSPP
ncbi:MAG: nicotinate-nucleotide--dimethylbenzimidazole phosphoribosyltransferase [Chloroflexi bacterium]|nr:nicotinate-nucleotide--dimethylbenzimidazole phosphoribosyltransferase [Chloroflexota bacterium]